MITDDMLSAFLDNALSAGDMERVRDAMAQDLAVADRLAELAQVDMVVKKAADVATRRPLPAAVVHLLGQHSMDATHGNNTKHTQVTRKELPFADTERQFDGSATLKHIGMRPTKRKSWTCPLAIAASLAVVAGLSFFQLDSKESQQSSYWANVSEALNTVHSGTTITLASGKRITPQLSFEDTQHNYCRQAQVQSNDELNVMIACKNKQGNWQLKATETFLVSPMRGEYQTASASNVFENELDKMMLSLPLNHQQEQQAIKQQWQVVSTAEGESHEN